MQNLTPAHVLVSARNVGDNLAKAISAFQELEKATSPVSVNSALRAIKSLTEGALRNLDALLVEEAAPAPLLGGPKFDPAKVS
jgi:hypothetical protein